MLIKGPINVITSITLLFLCEAVKVFLKSFCKAIKDQLLQKQLNNR